MKRFVLLAGSVALLVLGGAGFYAAQAALFSDDPGVTLTGCLNNGGSLNKLAVGDMPRGSCSGQEQLVHLGNGDITGVTAGTGLEGGADSGTATVDVDPNYRLPQTCNTGQLVGKGASAPWLCIDQPPAVSVRNATADECANGGFVLTIGTNVNKVCNGANGAPGKDGTITAEDLSSPNGEYSIQITDLGIYLHGPAGTFVVGPTGVETTSDAFAGN
jgi:hypothetical protein